MDSGTMPGLDDRLGGDLTALGDFAHELTRLGGMTGDDGEAGRQPGHAASGVTSTGPAPGRLNADPATVEQGLAKLVLSLIELLRRLLEKQALRRIEAGSLTDDEIERMGETFLRLERKMTELKATFGLQDEDLNLNLGPIGDLVRDP